MFLYIAVTERETPHFCMYNEGKHKLQREGITLLSGHLNCYAATENLLSVLLLTHELKKDLKD